MKRINIRNKIFGDLAWNYISIAIAAIGGAAFSIIISVFYPESILGRFNTVYSYYIILSQFCACGIHMAVTKYAAEYSTTKYETSTILCTAVLLCIMISIIVSTVSYICVNCFFYQIIGKSWVQSFNTIWVALVFFAINKVFLGWLNGCSRMRAYAFFQGARNVIIAGSLCLFVFLKVQGEMLTFCFLIAEGFLFILEILYSIWTKCFKIVFNTKYIRQIFVFGIRILPSNAVLELNTKIDVICLSFVLGNEKMVGVYSFAAMFAEGFYQLFVVIRKVINPSITTMYTVGKLKLYVENMHKKYIRYVYSIGMGIGTLICIGFYFIVLIIGKNEYLKGLLPLIIICAFIILNAKSIIYGNILAQTGNPTEESLANLLTTIFNGIANILLISQLGIIGAAIATGISYSVYNWTQKGFIQKRLNLLL